MFTRSANNKIGILVVIILVWVSQVNAQVIDTPLENLMTRKALDCGDISYNAVLLIPHLYRENKMDTLRALINYLEKKCRPSDPIEEYLLLESIKNNDFEEAMRLYVLSPTEHYMVSYPVVDTHVHHDFNLYKNNVIRWLRNYVNGCNVRERPKKFTPENIDPYLVKAYGEYYDFLQSVADSVSRRPGLSPPEKFLARFYAHPGLGKLNKLDLPKYNHTALQSAFRKNPRIAGFQIAITSGAMVPTGPLMAVGAHPYIGGTIGGRGKKLMIDLNGSIRVLNSPHNYSVALQDTLYKTRVYAQGGYAGLDCGYEIYRRSMHELDLLGGIGGDFFNTGNVRDSTIYFGTLNVNVGLGYKLYLRRKEYENNFVKYSYLTLQVKYNFLNFTNPGGTDLSGNALTVGLVYGLYYRNMNSRRSYR